MIFTIHYCVYGVGYIYWFHHTISRTVWSENMKTTDRYFRRRVLELGLSQYLYVSKPNMLMTFIWELRKHISVKERKKEKRERKVLSVAKPIQQDQNCLSNYFFSFRRSTKDTKGIIDMSYQNRHSSRSSRYSPIVLVTKRSILYRGCSLSVLVIDNLRYCVSDKNPFHFRQPILQSQVFTDMC